MGQVTKSEPNTKLSAYGLKKAGYLSQQTGGKLSLTQDTFSDKLAGMDKSVSKSKEFLDSIYDYNNRMYSHLLLNSKKHGLSLGPTAVAFRWKAGDHPTQDVDKIYRRFGYGNRHEPKWSNNVQDNKGESGMHALRKEGVEANRNLFHFGQKSRSKRRWKLSPLAKAEASQANTDSMYSNNFGTKKFQANRIPNTKSASPFTPPPPDGDPKFLRIFPIYDNPMRNGVAPNEMSTSLQRNFEAVSNSGNLYNPDGFLLTSREPRTNKRLPEWLVKALKKKRKQVGDMRMRRTNFADGYSFPNEHTARGENMDTGELRIGKGKIKCSSNRFDPSCINQRGGISRSLKKDIENSEKGISNHTFSYQEGKMQNSHRQFTSQARDPPKETPGSYEENIELLINFLSALLEEKSKTNRLDQVLDRRLNRKIPDFFDNRLLRSLSGSRAKTSHRPSTNIYNAQTFRPQRPPVRQPQRSRISHSVTTLPRESRHDRSSQNRGEEAVIDTDMGNGRNLPYNSHSSMTSTLTRDHDISNRFTEEINENSPIVDPDFDYNEGFTHNAPRFQNAVQTWESQAARNNRETMREYRRRMRKGGQRSASFRSKTRSRNNFQPNLNYMLNTADDSGISDPYSPEVGQGKGHYRLRSSAPYQIGRPQFIRHRPMPTLQSETSSYQSSTFPQPHPISRPETEPFPDSDFIIPRRNIQSNFMNNRLPSVSSFENEGAPQTFQIDHRSRHVVNSPTPKVSRFWQSVLPRQVGPTLSNRGDSQTQKASPRITRPPNLWQASTHLNTPVAFNYHTETTSQRIVCKSLITLSGGMDQWCSDNCQANFCPSTTCVCYTEGQPKPSVSYDRIGPTPHRSIANSYMQPYSGLAQDTYNGVRQNIAEAPIPLINSALSFHSPNRIEALQDRGSLTSKHTGTETIYPKRGRRLLAHKIRKDVRPKHGNFLQMHNQNIMNSRTHSLPHPIRELSIPNFDIESFNTQQRSQPFPGATISSDHAQSANPADTPNPYAPTARSSTVQEPTAPVKKYGDNIHQSESDGTDNNIFERTVPYSSSFYDTENTVTNKETPNSGCVAIGAYSGLQHFDEWCNITCKHTMCPLLLCSCSGYGYE